MDEDVCIVLGEEGESPKLEIQEKTTMLIGENAELYKPFCKVVAKYSHPSSIS